MSVLMNVDHTSMSDVAWVRCRDVDKKRRADADADADRDDGMNERSHGQRTCSVNVDVVEAADMSSGRRMAAMNADETPGCADLSKHGQWMQVQTKVGDVEKEECHQLQKVRIHTCLHVV